MSDQDLRPIVINVHDGRWDAYTPLPITERAKWLLSRIEELGGINESVSEGLHYFNIIEVDGVQIASLVPAQD